MKSIKSKMLQATLGAAGLVALAAAGSAQAAFVDLSASTLNGNFVDPVSNLQDIGKLYFDIEHNNVSTVSLAVDISTEEVGGSLDLGSFLNNFSGIAWPTYTLALGGGAVFSDTGGTLEPAGSLTPDSVPTPNVSIAWDPPLADGDMIVLGEVSPGDVPWVIDISGITGRTFSLDMTPVPVPAAVWLFGSALLGLIGIARRRQVA